ncbi:glycosyltransferase family 2 protein [Micromonospora sp. KC723]|uniref:glycosyltransferase family 2 protein n=1 Tax=Micromonospora sp. KC723 TaxID=2530381 RepID=UPI00104873CA|nr:glycosyltransferase family 2 protein [Micromonospora sp. KC723]TDB78259.1 glycosyltransferase family 2 protein [Micromonospora sp. KC723]
MAPVLSVIVPVFDVEPYLDICLKSLAGQDHGDLEVVVVDDASADGSRAIADRWAREDSRIRVLEQPHGGLSAARNTGLRAARGTYLAFCDGDDVVPAVAYKSLIAAIEESGSDFASGAVRRVDSTGVRPHYGYHDVFDKQRRRTHIRRLTALVRDRMVWNKVFRRSFWDAADLSFSLPAYEDAPVMMRAHIAATAVDVVTDVVYLWRLRERGQPSITQRYREPDNVAAWMRMIVDTYNVIRDGVPELVPAYADDMCRGDVPMALGALHLHDAAALHDALTLARSFVVNVPAEVIDGLPERTRRILGHLVDGDTAAVRELVEPS